MICPQLISQGSGSVDQGVARNCSHLRKHNLILVERPKERQTRTITKKERINIQWVINTGNQAKEIQNCGQRVQWTHDG